MMFLLQQTNSVRLPYRPIWRSTPKENKRSPHRVFSPATLHSLSPAVERGPLPNRTAAGGQTLQKQKTEPAVMCQTEKTKNITIREKE